MAETIEKNNEGGPGNEDQPAAAGGAAFSPPAGTAALPLLPLAPPLGLAPPSHLGSHEAVGGGARTPIRNRKPRSPAGCPAALPPPRPAPLSS